MQHQVFFSCYSLSTPVTFSSLRQYHISFARNIVTDVYSREPHLEIRWNIFLLFSVIHRYYLAPRTQD